MNDKAKDKTNKKTILKKDSKIEEPKVKLTQETKPKAAAKAAKVNLVQDIEIKDVIPQVTATKSKKPATKEVETKTVTAESLIEEFDVNAVSSSEAPVRLTPLKTPEKAISLPAETEEISLKTEKDGEAEELSPIFKELALPKLPSLPAENRAYLQMQSPNRIFFYWSIKGNPYETLHKGLGNRAENYQLIVKLVNLTSGSEEFHPVESSGSWWFNVQSDSNYRAEVGFLAPNRPFIRLVFSNILETPRSQPSANRDFSTFTVSSDQFAEVLEAAGFTQDAFDVYLAGDDVNFADTATQKAFEKLAGEKEVNFEAINLNELRYILFALASGVSLVTLRDRVSSALFDFIGRLANENPDALSEEKVILALEEFFGIDFAEEQIDEEYFSSAVYGASLVNFPNGVRRHKSRFAPTNPKFTREDWGLSPISSAASR